MSMKRFLAVSLLLLSALGFSGCGGADETGEKIDPVPVRDASTLINKHFIDPTADWYKFDGLIEQIKQERDFAKRVQLMHQAENFLMGTYAAVPLYYGCTTYLQKDYVKDVYCTRLGILFLMHNHLENGADTLRLCIGSEPEKLDPALNSEQPAAIMLTNSFSGLYTYDEQDNTVPDCAEGYTVSEDGLHYTVKLREGLKWSDGSDLVAEDFAYAWKRAAAEETAAEYAYLFQGFQGYPNNLSVSAPDSRTLVFDLTSPCAYMEALLAFPVFFPVKKSAVESFPDWQKNPGGWCTEAGFVSNGPYRCTAWQHDSFIRYEKNPYWHNADKVATPKIEYMLSADTTAIYAAYQAGDLSISQLIPVDEIPSLLGTSEFKNFPDLSIFYFAFNVKGPLFADKTPAQAAAMREAFSLLIDRDYLCDNILQAGQTPANAFVPPGMSDGNRGIFRKDSETGGYFDIYGINNDYKGTLERVRLLLASAGYRFDEYGMLSAETPIQVTYLTNPTSTNIAIAESLQQDFSSIGIEMIIQQPEWKVYLAERKLGHFDLARAGWAADINDPISMLDKWITPSGNNECQFGR